MESAPFTAIFQATPNQNDMDGVVGFSLNAASDYTNLAVIARFNASGTIDARNGGSYAADVSLSYTAGQRYSFRLVINPSTEHYNVYVTPPGGSEIALASNYAFRSEQSSTSTLNNWVMISDVGSEAVCNMSITPGTISSSTVAPVITAQPASQTIAVGQTAMFVVTASGTAPLTYQWSKNGTAISGATSSSYTTPATTAADNGARFSVTVSHSAGSITSNPATLTVSSTATCVSGVQDTWENTSFSTQTAQFTATYTATPSQNDIDGVVGFSLNPASDYASLAAITRFNSSGDIDVRNGGSYTADVTVPYSAGLQYSFRLVINPSLERYSVYVTPSGGSEIALASNYAFRSEQSSTSSLNNWAVYSEIGTVSVCHTIMAGSTSATPPSITTQPLSQTIVAGQTATFWVTATGTGPMSYQWNKNGTAMTGATTSSYTTPAETTSDNGAKFTVLVSNSAGNVTSSAAALTVNAATSAPSITSQPSIQTITAGQTATFSVVASGTAPLSYQWNKNGTAISGATASSYTTPAETTSDNGAKFTVVVSNSTGSVTSNTATLTVNANTYLLSAGVPSLNFGSTTVGNGSTVQVTLTNSGNSSVTISKVTISGAGFTASGIAAGQVITAGNSGTLNVTFAPSATGAVTGSVIVSSNATNSPVTITLAGIGVQLSSGAHPPALFFTDLANGPATGNSDPSHISNGGAYVTLYGNFFGSTQGSSTVTLNGASCLKVVSWGQSWLWYQKIVVQLTAGCSSGNFVVSTSNGSSNGMPFAVASGSIYYVSTTGNDSGNGSFATPFRTFLHGVNTAGAGAGNIVYVENGYTDTSSDPRGWGNAVWNPDVDNCRGTKNAMNGVVAYPGASVTIGSATGSLQTIRSVDNGSTQICPGYWTVAGMKFVSGTDNVVITGDALSNTHAQYWRWIANDVSNPNSNSGEGANWETSQVEHESVYGNYFHDMNLGTTSNLSQGVYPSSDSDHFDMGWNLIYNAKGRATVQIHSSPLTSGVNGFGLYDMKIHDNMIHGSSEECLLVDTTNPANGPVLVYNNVIWGCGQDLAASNGDNLRLSGSGDFTQSQGTGYGTWVEFYNNTIYCTGGVECSGSEYTDNNRNNAPALSQHNQLLLSSCTGSCATAYGKVPYFLVSNGDWGAAGSFYCGNSDTPSTCAWARGSNNLVFGNGGPTYTNLYTGTINLDPKLVSPSTADFHLQPGGPAIGTGIASWNGVNAPTYDIDGRIRPNPPSIGAYESN